jgi:hypothetical protein
MYVEVETAPPASRGYVVWLDQSGNPTWPIFSCQKRVVDFLLGDQIRHNGKRYKVASVEPFLQHLNAPADFLRERSSEDGFVAE